MDGSSSATAIYNNQMEGYTYSRSRRSVASTSGTIPAATSTISVGDGPPDIDDRPPDITPVGGVPNLKGKVVIRPIAFRPTPGRPGSSTGPQPAICSRPGSLGPSPAPGPPFFAAGGPPSAGTGHISRPASQGFGPGNQLVKDSNRSYGSSQELNRCQPSVSSLLAKFSSLDRRSVSQRSCRSNNNASHAGVSSSGHHHHQSPQSIPSNGLRMTTYSYDNGSSTSLPPVGLTPQASSTVNTNRDLPRLSKEPERRHSLYDSGTRNHYQSANSTTGSGPSSSTTTVTANTAGSGPSQTSSGVGGPGSAASRSGGPQPATLNPMNMNGLPEPGSHMVHHSKHSLPQDTSVGSRLSQEPRSRHSGAGTPQFRNAAGLQFPLPRGSRGSLSNLSSQIGNGFTLQRSISGTSIHFDDQSSLINRGDSTFKGSTSTIDQEYNTTPSPSDSAVGDLENVLKEKDSEIGYLRETLEQNEHVIFKVYEEKERVWEREIRKIKGLYENRLKSSQQKASKMEQALMNQTMQVQNEKRKLERELSDLLEARQSHIQETRDIEAHLSQLRRFLSGDEESCPSSLNVSSSDESSKVNSKSMSAQVADLRSLRAELTKLQETVESRKQESDRLARENKHLNSELINLRSLADMETEGGGTLKEVLMQKEIIIERDKEIEKLQDELREVELEKQELVAEVERHKENFLVEKANWLDEKEKVIRYQKQLQLNYVQMYKKNKTLEAEVDQLKKTLAESSHSKQSGSGSHTASTKSRLLSKFSKFHSGSSSNSNSSSNLHNGESHC